VERQGDTPDGECGKRDQGTKAREGERTAELP
jgi:hypothetical protein